MNQITVVSPQLDIALEAIMAADLADSTKLQYSKAVTNYLATGNSLGDADAIMEYNQGAGKSRSKFLVSAVKMWFKRLSQEMREGVTTETLEQVQVNVMRMEAISEKIKTEKGETGEKPHTWLSLAEVKQLLDSCNVRTMQGKRDRLVLLLSLHAGLRRDELSNLKFEDILLKPVDGKFRTVIHILGKGAKNRTVPIRDEVAKALDEWGELVGTEGKVVRALTRGGAIKDSLSVIGIVHIVKKAGETIGKENLAPHDLRRTFAQNGYDAGVGLNQIRILLGHSSLATTQKYLDRDVNLSSTISDFIPV